MADPIQPSNIAVAVATSGLKAEQSRMRVIAENLANADSTAQTPGGEPYRRQIPVFAPMTVAGAKGVAMTHIAADSTQFGSEYAPGHPAADSSGYVKLPNVNPMLEAIDMRNAQRAYQANLSVIETAQSMDTATLSIIQK